MDPVPAPVTLEITVKSSVEAAACAPPDHQQYPPLLQQITITFTLGIALLLVGLVCFCYTHLSDTINEV